MKKLLAILKTFIHPCYFSKATNIKFIFDLDVIIDGKHHYRVLKRIYCSKCSKVFWEKFDDE